MVLFQRWQVQRAAAVSYGGLLKARWRVCITIIPASGGLDWQSTLHRLPSQVRTRAGLGCYPCRAIMTSLLAGGGWLDTVLFLPWQVQTGAERTAG